MKTRIDNVNEYVNSMNAGIASLEKNVKDMKWSLSKKKSEELRGENMEL